MTETALRPPPPHDDLPSDLEWVAVPDDDNTFGLSWTIDPNPNRVCRYSTRQPCHNEPVAYIVRGRSKTRYYYCGEHMYGRWIEDGRVMMWLARHAEEPHDA